MVILCQSRQQILSVGQSLVSCLDRTIHFVPKLFWHLFYRKFFHRLTQMVKVPDPYLRDQMPWSYQYFSIATKKSKISRLLVLMVWVVFESGGFCFSMIFYNGSRTSQTNDSKKKKKKYSGSNSSSICFPRLTNHYLFTGFPWCLITIHSIYGFSSINTCAAWLLRLPDWALFWEPVFSLFVEPSSDLKRPKWYYVTVMGKKLLLLEFNKKIWVGSRKCYVDKEFGIATTK